jgi:cytochrome b561
MSFAAAAARVLAGSPFNSNPAAIPGVTNLQTIIGYACWIATALCLIGLTITGATMAVSYHRGSNEHVGRLGGVAAGCLVVGAASPIAGAILGFNLFTSSPQAIPGLSGVQTVISYVSWIAAALCLIGLIIAGAMLAVSYQRGNSEHAGRLGGVATGCLIVGGASTIIGALI